MKTKFLIGAFAFPLFIASCSNDELDVVQNEMPQEFSEVVGNKLVGNGLTISVSKYGEVESRLNANGWQTKDMIGLAWYNGADAITKNQIPVGTKAKPLAWFDEEGVKPATHTLQPAKMDKPEIYGNHKFIYGENGNFATESSVYEGFHFAYYPYARANKVEQMTITANGVNQTSEYDADIYKNAFHISAQDVITEASVAEDGSVEKAFNLKRLVNILNFSLVPEASWSSNEILKNMKVTSVKLDVKQPLFVPAVDLIPAYLPSAVYTDGEYDAESTLEKMTWAKLYGASNKALKLDGSASTSITTNVDMETSTLDAAKSYRMFLFPTIAPATTVTAKDIKLTVTIAGGSTFNITYNTTTDANKAKLDIIAAMLNGAYEANNKTYTLQDVMDGSTAGRQNGPVKLAFDLVASEFKVSYNKIASRPQWNDAVALATALAQEKNIEFVVTDDVDFGADAKDAINLPTIPEKGSLTIKTSGAKGQIHILGNVKWPNEVENISWNNAAKIVVGEGGALTVTPNGSLNAAVTIEEGGKVIVNKNAYFNAEASANQTLNNGRIEVVYGSHVENVNGASTGDVAFVLKATTKAYEINKLIEPSAASVTTLVVGKGVNLNLNLSDVVDDPYGVQQTLNSLAAINVELTGGSVTGNLAKQNAINNLKVLSGTTNKIVDVKPVDIYVANKASLDITTTANQKLPLNTVNVKNYGVLNIDAESHFNNIINEGTINGNKTVHYVGTFNNAKGTAKGVEPCGCTPDVDYTTLESAVTAAMDAWKEASANTINQAYVVDKVINSYTSSEYVKAFYDALKAWFDAKVADGVLANTLPAYDSFNDSSIILYQALSGTPIVFE